MKLPAVLLTSCPLLSEVWPYPPSDVCLLLLLPRQRLLQDGCRLQTPFARPLAFMWNRN